MSGGTREDRGGTTGRALLVLLGWLLLCALAVWVAWLTAADRNSDGRCEGIGWGCTMTPKDSIGYAGLFLGIPAGFGVLVVGSVVLAVLERRGSRLRALARGTVAFWSGTAAVLAVVTAAFVV